MYQEVLKEMFNTDRVYMKAEIKDVNGEKAYDIVRYVNNQKDKVLLENVKAFRYMANYLIPVCLNKVWGMIDILGRWVIKPKYFDVRKPYNGLIVARDTNHKFGAFNLIGTQVIPFQYDSLSDFDESGYAVYKLDDVCGLLHKSGEEYPTSYKDISLSNGFVSYVNELGEYRIMSMETLKEELI